MGDVPPEFEISDLTKPPIAYQDRQSTAAGQNSFSNALKRAVDLKNKFCALSASVPERCRFRWPTCVVRQCGRQFPPTILLEQHAQMRSSPIIRRRDVFHPIGVRGKLIAFSETGALRIVRIVNSDGFAAVLFHDREARHIGGAVADESRVSETESAGCRLHVIVHVLRHVEQPFVYERETAFSGCD